MSPTGQRILGTWIEDTQPSEPVALWVQEQLRGADFHLARMLEKFAAQLPEKPDPRRVVVTQVSPARIECHIPCAVLDHESPHPFRREVALAIDPAAGKITELCR